MDFDKRLDELHADFERRRREFTEKYRSDLSDRINRSTDGIWRKKYEEPEYLKPETTPRQEHDRENTPTLAITKLMHHEGLEGESLAKLGSFERLVSNSFSHLTIRTLSDYGISDDDFSPMVNLLGCICEIELMAALKPIAEGAGLRPMEPEKGWKFWELNKLVVTEPIAGMLSGRNYVPAKIKSYLETIRTLRNQASHTGIISKALFVDRYEKSFVPFFNNELPGIISLKNIKAPGILAAGTYDDSDIIFATPVDTSQYQISMLGEADTSYRDSIVNLTGTAVKREPHCVPADDICILWTDVDKLTIKYFGALTDKIQTTSGIEKFDHSNVTRALLNKFIIDAAQRDRYFLLLDASAPEYANILRNDEGWESYNRILQNYISKLVQNPKQLKDGRQFRVQEPVNVMIIGGDDVIPMPKFTSPVINDSPRESVLENTVDSDWPYAFDTGYSRKDADGRFDFTSISGARTRAYVSRLPLESGLIMNGGTEGLANDIIGYLYRSLEASLKPIDVKSLCPVIMESCRLVARKTLSSLPLADTNGIERGFCDNGMFLSPGIELNARPGDIRYEPTIAYCQRVKEYGMIYIFLHGSPIPSRSAFSGEPAANNPKAEALKGCTGFDPQLLENSKIRFVTTGSCWGARFIGYSRDNSFLLSSFHKNGLLSFFGSSRSAWASFDVHFGNPNAVRPTISILLTKLFMENVSLGKPVGRAMAEAKKQYMDYMARDQFFKATNQLTLLQFNLFGSPCLRIKPLISEPDINSRTGFNFEYPEFSNIGAIGDGEIVYNKKDAKEKLSLLERARRLVDRNLDQMRQRLTRVLYDQYGLEPEKLCTIRRYSTADGKPIYRLAYHDDDDMMNAIVFTDSEERIVGACRAV